MTSQDIKWLFYEKHGGQKTVAFLDDCIRLKNGEPLAYVIGYTPFLGLEVDLSTKPLIPRPETEFWTELAIGVIKDAAEASPQPLRVLDLCAGSGCIGAAVLSQVDNCHVDFVEIDSTHHASIKKTLLQNLPPGYESRTLIYDSDLFNAVPAEVQYDFILSNPPYIDPALDRTEASVTKHEPHQALYGGAEGLECITQIIGQSPSRLATSSQLWLEHEPEQVSAITKLAAQHGFEAETRCDQYQVERFTILTKQ